MERLEARCLLDGTGFLTGADAHLTLSFAADGTQIAGQSSHLQALFDAIAPTNVWQDAILSAFQAWAVNTNADIGVVADGGQPFGTPGSGQKDNRFGDIRIGAIEMAPSVAAVAIPIDGLVSGTWFADVLFNTAYNFQSVDDILAIALHESGNVFGLDDNADPNSPLHSGNPPVVRMPTAADIDLLQQLYGARAADVNELSAGSAANNDTFVDATELKPGRASSIVSGSAPTVVYGDITHNSDLDYYFIDSPSSYTGSLTVEVRTQGISLLAPSLRVYDKLHQLVGEASSNEAGGSLVSVHLASTASSDRFYLEVSGADPGDFGIGGYSVVTTFDSRNTVDRATIDAVAGGAYRFLVADEIAKLFTSHEDFYNTDLHTNDETLNAIELNTVNGFVSGTRYETIGSISDSTDVDYYAVKAPKASGGSLPVMTVAVRSLDVGGLLPEIEILTKDGQSLPATILANGGGDCIIQFTAAVQDTNYLVKVAAHDPGGLFSTGNYSLTVTFGANATVFESLGLTPLPTIGNGVTQREHTLYVGKPQLFHFVMEAGNVPVASPTALVATIVNDQGQQVYQFSTHPGESRSREAVLLAPGTYHVRVVILNLDGSIPPEIPYNIRWTAISDPFVGDPTDPTNNPFACTEPGLQGYFCYPGGIISPDPFLWDSFIGSLTTPPPTQPLNETITLLFGDWWTWAWAEFGVNGPVFAFDDVYHAPPEVPLIVANSTSPANGVAAITVAGPQGLLSNDIDPERASFVALLDTDVSHGTLTLQTDGSFTYTPNPGFTGMDQFTYKAFDFYQNSNIGTVKIVVGDSGDFDVNGVVSGIDFLAWQRGFGIASGATLAMGDANLDFDVDVDDFNVWQAQYGSGNVPIASNGDADGNGQVNGLDFLAWQRGFGITAGATAADGDANASGSVDAADLAIWNAHYGTTGAIAALAPISVLVPQQFSALLSVPATPSMSVVAQPVTGSTAEASPEDEVVVDRRDPAENCVPRSSQSLLAEKAGHSKSARHRAVDEALADFLPGRLVSSGISQRGIRHRGH